MVSFINRVLPIRLGLILLYCIRIGISCLVTLIAHIRLSTDTYIINILCWNYGCPQNDRYWKISTPIETPTYSVYDRRFFLYYHQNVDSINCAVLTLSLNSKWWIAQDQSFYLHVWPGSPIYGRRTFGYIDPKSNTFRYK